MYTAQGKASAAWFPAAVCACAEHDDQYVPHLSINQLANNFEDKAYTSSDLVRLTPLLETLVLDFDLSFTYRGAGRLKTWRAAPARPQSPESTPGLPCLAQTGSRPAS